MQRRDHPSPVTVVVRDADEQCLSLDVALWGRRAVQEADLVVRALELVGRNGLSDGARRVAFEVAVTPSFVGTLAEWVEQHPRPPSGATATIRLVSPCATECAAALRPLVANIAHDLVQWELEDAGLSASLGKNGCDRIAEDARLRAAAALDTIRVESGPSTEVRLGRRWSRSNRRRFPLQGIVQEFRLSGDLTEAWPWLLALARYGAGGRRSFGFGRVALSVEAPGR